MSKTKPHGFYSDPGAVRRIVQAVAVMRASAPPEPAHCLPTSGYAEDQPSVQAAEQFERAAGDAPMLGAD